MIKRLLLRPKYWRLFSRYLSFPFKWKLLDIFYELIRSLFVKDIDINEDYYCGWCNKPVLRRYLFCSTKCSDDMEKDINWLHEPLTEEELAAFNLAGVEEGEPW